MLKIILSVGAGGFLGSVARYLVGRYSQQIFLSSYPYGTFIVNITGCFFIGLLFGLSDKGDWLSPEWRFFLGAGFLGGFTTFSTFSLENIQMLREGDIFHFFLYTGLTLVLGLGATFAGLLITRYF
jgi:CrcB protein